VLSTDEPTLLVVVELAAELAAELVVEPVPVDIILPVAESIIIAS
jgi:hypothetical protein